MLFLFFYQFLENEVGVCTVKKNNFQDCTISLLQFVEVVGCLQKSCEFLQVFNGSFHVRPCFPSILNSYRVYIVNTCDEEKRPGGRVRATNNGGGG